MPLLLMLFSFFLNDLSADPFREDARRPTSNEPVGYVVADDPSWGRLGNQFFVVATTLSYGWDNGFIPVFPEFNRQDNQLSYNRDRVFFRLNTEHFPFQIHRRYSTPGLHYHPIPIFKNKINVALRGQYVSWKFFHHHREELLDLFAPSADIEDYLSAKYPHLADHPETVSVHVRTYSKELYDQGYPFLGKNFYALAFQYFSKEALFVVFSDRIHWCKNKFLEWFPELRFEFIEGNDHVEDFYLMASTKHQIISNSTYSWWAAYLNRNAQRKIICPQQFFRNPGAIKTGDLYVPEWRLIPYDFTSEPYPEDMTDFDPLTADDLKQYK